MVKQTTLPTESTLFVQTLPPRCSKLFPSPKLLRYASASIGQGKTGRIGGHFESFTAVNIHEVLNSIVSLLSFLRKKKSAQIRNESHNCWLFGYHFSQCPCFLKYFELTVGQNFIVWYRTILSLYRCNLFDQDLGPHSCVLTWTAPAEHATLRAAIRRRGHAFRYSTFCRSSQ